MNFISSKVIPLFLLVVWAVYAADNDRNRPNKRRRTNRSMANRVCQQIQTQWRDYFPQAQDIDMQFCVENIPPLQNYIISQYQSWDQCFRSPEFQQHLSWYSTPQQVFDKLQREQFVYYDLHDILRESPVYDGPPTLLSDDQWVPYICQLYYEGSVNDFVKDFTVGTLYNAGQRSVEALGHAFKEYSYQQCTQFDISFAQVFSDQSRPSMDECIPALLKMISLVSYTNGDWTALLRSVDRSAIDSGDEQLSVFQRLVQRIDQQTECVKLVFPIVRDNESAPHSQSFDRRVIVDALNTQYEGSILHMCSQTLLLEGLQTTGNTENALARELEFEQLLLTAEQEGWGKFGMV